MKDRTKLLIACISVALVAAIAVVVMIAAGKNDTPQNQATPDETAATRSTQSVTSATAQETQPATMSAENTTAAESTAAATEPHSESDATQASKPTDAPAQPEELERMLGASGSSVEELTANGCRQLVTVSASGSSARISLYTCEDGQWKRDEALDCSGFIGGEGTISPSSMSEQHSATPLGLYSIGEAFYQYSAPQTGLSAFQITQNTYWVDDPDSAYYNQRVDDPSVQDWSSAEHMIDYDNYEYGFVINYNAACEYNKGSAIFFHVGSSPTAGCVAVSREMVLSYLSALNASASPYILIAEQ